MKAKFLLLICIWITGLAFAQVTNQGSPLSWSLTQLSSPQPEILPTVVPGESFTNQIKDNQPYRFGQEIEVSFHPNTHGTWDDLGHGKIWRLLVISPNAVSLNFIFSDFFIPEGGHLYIYNNDKTDLLGAYTSEQNRPEGLLGTWPVSGDQVWIEYYEPKSQAGKGQLHIQKVVHGFYQITGDSLETRGYNDSSSCNYDVNCDIGYDFSNQKEYLKRSVALFIVGGSVCTGTLINNVENNQAPYFITANHCDDGNPGTWAFRFNWHRDNPICGTPGTSTNPSYHQTISGATKLMSNPKTDVMLLRIQGNLPYNWNLYWAGWNRSSEEVSEFTVSIHHPSGDVMKICRDNEAPIKLDAPFNNHPEVSFWKIENWEYGLTENGSSGAALFDSHGRIIGQLAGGMSQCVNGSYNGLSDYYGRFDVSWDYGDTPETRLSDWLDPFNTGVIFTEGLSSPSFDYQGSLLIFPNPVSTYLYINNNSFAGLNYKIYTPSGQLIQQDHLTQINNRLNLSHLAEGIYFIYLNDNFTNNSTVKQLIVKK